MSTNSRRTVAAATALLALAACGDPTSPGDSPVIALVFERATSPSVTQTTLFVMHHQSAVPVPVWPDTEDPAAQPRSSADGRWIAFMAPHPGTADDAVWITRADGSERREVLTSASMMSRPAPSPDGSKIAFVRYDETGESSRIWVVNADGTDAHAVTDAAHSGPFIYTAPAWSPSGNRLAFAMGTPGHLRIATIAAGGGSISMVTQPPAGSDVDPVYSPDGSILAFVRTASPSQNDVMLVQAATGSLRTLYSGNGRQPTWTPDGQAIVIAARVGAALADLYVIPFEGGDALRLTSTDFDERSPTWVRLD